MTKPGSGIILLMLISLWGCSKANDNTIILDASGKHPAGWVVALVGGLHPVAYQVDQNACKECHGSSTDSTASGGISGVSCFSPSRSGTACHPGGPSGHPAGWGAAGSHGSASKAAAPGMSYCTQCHGSGFAGGIGKSCMTCHTTAPHPTAPWRGTTTSGTTHTTANPVNAAECARCHLNNQRLTAPQSVPAGTTPDCFNNTLCHGAASGHPAGWSAPSSHGSAAKAAPGASQGFFYCTQCHGTDFVSSSTSCKTCHKTAPHPVAADWRSAGTITHITTDPNNASVCAACHNSSSPNLAAPNLARFVNSPAGSFNGGSPNCFSASSCHGDVRKTGNCDACHSTAATIPFKSMAGATAVSDPKVGAHVKHVSAASQTFVYSSNINCSECHAVPVSPVAAGAHRNGTNDISFGALAKTASLTPAYNAATGTCSNTYCHGNSLDKPVSAVLSPVWKTPFLTGNPVSDCGKCHGYPPATATHTGKTPTDCIGCHSHVNSTGTGFTDPAKHINGSVEASGAHAVPYLVHNAVASPSCLTANGGCHITGTGTSSYPATAGSPPHCMSCHTLADPLVTGNGMGNCKSCHGTGGTGTAAAPTGTTWPNIRGTNSNARHPSHEGSSCGTCHPNVGSTGRFTGTIAAGTVASGSGAGVNHGPNKAMTSGSSQTNSIKTTIGIVPKIPRGSGATCTHGSLAVSGCHDGPGTKTW